MAFLGYQGLLSFNSARVALLAIGNLQSVNLLILGKSVL